MEWMKRLLRIQTHEEKRRELQEKLRFALSQSVAR